MTKAFLLIFFLTLLPTFNAGADGFRFSNLKAQPIRSYDCETPLHSAKTVRLADEKEIVLTAWNPENVTSLQGKYKYNGLQSPGGRYDYKPVPLAGKELEEWKFPAKQKKIANVGKDLNLKSTALSHFVVAPEVESIEAAERLFNGGILKNKYDTYLISGNDPRGINIAFAVRSDLDVKIEMETHREAKWYDPVEKHSALLFTRDVPALIVRDGQTDQPLMILLGTHYKSLRDRADGRDPKSAKLRAAQIEATAQIVTAYQQEYGPEVPILLAGDFNTDLRNAPEVAPLKRVLSDSFDVLKVRDRVTHTFHPTDDTSVGTQLDAIMMTANAKPYLLRATVLPEFDPWTGERMGNPMTYQDRQEKYPSDHRAIAIVLSGRIFRR